VEAGSNTSTVTLRVVGGDAKGSLKSETVKKGYAAEGQQHIQKQTRPIVREGAPQNKTVTVKE
jgi:hypothetical protein